MSSASQSYRTRSKTLPARVKSQKNIEQDSKSRSSLPFRRLADLLKRKRKRGKGEADPLNSLALDKQAWYHGKITADFAERYLRRDGNFLVREDPAMPGSCFIVVRHRRSAQHIQLCKVNSSKGTRIKYKIEDSDKSFDSISELINHHVAEKKPLSPKTSAVITHAVSRDATLLSTDDLKNPCSKHNRYVSNTGPANLCPPKPPGTGPLRQRKLERKNSDPGYLSDDVRGNHAEGLTLSSENQNRSYHTDNWKWTVQAKQRERIPEVFIQKGPKTDKVENGVKPTTGEENRNKGLQKEALVEGLDRYDDKPFELENAAKPSENESLAMCNNTAIEENSDESYYDKPTEDSYYDKPTETENASSYNDELPRNAEAFYDKPVIHGNDDSLYDQPKDSHESLYDKPRDTHELESKTKGHQDILYDIPRDSQDNLYDKPSNIPKRMPSFRNSDPTPSVSSKVDKCHSLRPQLVSRCSAPSLRAAPAGSATSNAFSSPQMSDGSASRSKPPMEKRHSDVGILLRQTLSKNSFSDFKVRDQTPDDESYYSTPPRSLEHPCSGASKQQGGDSLSEEQDPPREISSLSVSRDSGNTNQLSPQNSKIKIETANSQLEPPKSVDKQGIFLSVMKKIRETLLLPFLECDCTSLARHMTRVDVSLIWGDDPASRAWTFEDGTGGAEGLEMLTLPQGREMRADLLERFSDISNWVATLIVAAGDLSTREQVLSKLIELADALSDQLGNLVSFMAVMDGLCLPQVTRLHHTWSCLHHQHCSVAILYHSTLKPLASLLSSGAPSPFPGVCLPYMVPLMRYMEMTFDDILNDLEYTEVDLGLGTIFAHLESGRILAQQIEEFRQEAAARLQMEECSFDSKLIEYFNNNLNVASVLGLEASTTSRGNKLRTLLQWLSENAEHPAHASS